MSRRAAETSPFGLSRWAANSVKIEYFFQKIFSIFLFLEKIWLFSELKNIFLIKNTIFRKNKIFF
jgi:lipid-A-disaccharide synthase-like uncharacterized protein